MASQIAQLVKNLPANAGDTGDAGLIPDLGRSPRGGNGNPFQYSCLENPMDRGAWQATVYKVTKSQTRLNDFTLTFQLLSSAELLVTPWTAAHQAPLSMGFSRQEYWSGVPLPSPTSPTGLGKRETSFLKGAHKLSCALGPREKAVT